MKSVSYMQIGDSQSNDKKKQVKRNIEPAIKIAKFNSFNPLLNILIALMQAICYRTK